MFGGIMDEDYVQLYFALEYFAEVGAIIGIAISVIPYLFACLVNRKWLDFGEFIHILCVCVVLCMILSVIGYLFFHSLAL